MTSKQNGGYRSPSGRSRNRSRTRSYDSYDDYSDSFESETEADLKKSSSSNKAASKRKPVGIGTTSSNKKPVNSRVKNTRPTPTKGKSNKNGRGSTQVVVSPRDMDAVSKRMLSARRLKINELRNQVEELSQLVQDLKLENRTMKQDTRRQDKALSRYEVQEGELPSLISRHGEEVRTLRDQLKRSKEKYENGNKRYKDLDEELHRTRKQLKKLKDLSDNKKLGERDELARKLTQTEIEADEKDKKIRDLERYIDNLQKNQRHELAIEIHRHRETQRRVGGLEDMIQGLEVQIREKEKILDIKNIYSNRIVRPPHKLPSGNSTPLSMKRSKRSSLSDHGTTPRDKMKQYEERRREEDRKQREARRNKIKENENVFITQSQGSPVMGKQTPCSVSTMSTQTTPPPPTKTEEELSSRSPTPSPPSPKSESDGEDSERERRKGELIKRNQEYSSRNSIAHDEVEEEVHNSAEWQYKKDKERWDAEEEEKRKRAEEVEEARRQDRENRDRKDRERMDEREQWEQERAEDELKRRREKEAAERHEREERERHEREEHERRERDDRERVEEERRYREDKERRERDERESREQEEREKRIQEDRERLEQDTRYQEERRKKDELLAKLRAMDDKDNDSQNMFKQNKQVDRMKSERSNVSAGSSKKSYAFTKPIENMHKGKPSHEDNTIPYIEKRRRSGFMDEEVPYRPTFDDSKESNQQAKKKADLMKNLFGDSGTSNHAEPAKRATGKPEVEDLDGGNEFFLTKSNKRPSKDADLAFAFSSNNNRGRNENGSSDSKLLPRRQSQQATTITKPTVMAIDDPDDLEEVIL